MAWNRQKKNPKRGYEDMENNVTLQEATHVARLTRRAAKREIFHEEWSKGQDEERGG